MDAAKKMSQLDWADTRVIALPVEFARYAPQFLVDSGFKAQLSSDFEKIRERFHYVSYPYGVALENGYQTGALTHFEGEEPAATLKTLGLIR